MKIFKLLRGVIARYKAVHTRRRSTIRDAPTLRSLPDAATLSPQAIETAIPTETAVVMEPALSIDTERLEEGGPGEFDVFGSIPSHSVGEADGLEEVVSTRELLTRQSAPSPDAGAQITHRTGTGEYPQHVATAVTRRRSVVHGQHSRKPYTPKFDVSQHPDVSDVEVEEFLQCAELGTLDAVANLPAPRLDALLMRALNRVRLIGELPINGAAFRQIAEIMRTTYIVRGMLNVRGIPPAIFVTSMVFCARYAEEEARNFWTPYARLVWGLPEASLTFQNRCRKHFEVCRNCLKEWYGFSFPIVAGQDGSVVRPVYHHAVIPFYLEDAFAIWLVQTPEHVQQLASDFGPEVLPTLLADEPSLNRVPPSLRSFILGETTSTTAAGLILQLCEAAAAYLSGEENVAHLISSPIERALWHKVQRELDGRIESERMRRGSQPVLTWGWLLEDEELQLRLAHVSSSDGAPNLIVWTEKGETALSDSDHCEFLEGYLWRRRDGWSLDEIRLSGGPVDGQIAVLSEDHEDDRPDVLFQSDVPLLPSGVILFARESQQEWATFAGRDRVTDGDWLISMAQGVALYDADGKPIASYQEEYVPDLLREHSAHTTAGRYLLQLPVTVTQGGEPLYTIERLTEQIGTPVLEGPCQLPDLSSRVPPVFSGLPITLRIPGITNELLSHTMLSVRSATFHKPYSLEELRTGSAMSMSVEGDCTIALDTLFPDEAGVYTLNLRRGLKSLLDEPLQFGYLPGLEVEAPEPKRHYTPANLPSARIFGVTAEQVVVDGTRAKRELIAGAVQVTWHDLRAPECSLRLDINDQSIALAWPINRTYAWVDNLSEAGRLRRKDRNAATIHVRGMRHQRASWRVGGDSERELLLDAKGARDIELGRDQLIDIIEVRRETHVPVEICSEGETWLLFEYVRKPDLAVQHVTYDADKKQLILECRVGPVCEGEFLVRTLKANASADEPVVVGNFDLLKEHLIFDHGLSPGQYEVQILSRGEPIDIKGLHIPEAPVESIAPAKRRKPVTERKPRLLLMPSVQMEIKRRRVEVPQFKWSEVPAGPFVMGGDHDAEGAWPGGEFDLPYRFWISIFPVTVAQFRVFVHEGGYDDYEFWKAQCWGRKGEPPKLEHRGSYRDEKPIARVTWCEAFAFANWLNNELPRVKPADAPEGYVVRLPRECEWEKAARYPDGRLFPWGNDWDATRLHWKGYRAKGLRRVGSFPMGAQSELGICDLLGNVTEWCLTAWRETYVSPQDESNVGKADEERCIRGGSWATRDPSRLRSAARMKAAPGYRSSYIGFRLVVSKPIRWIR